jgi:uncharacterized protein YkwD
MLHMNRRELLRMTTVGALAGAAPWLGVSTGRGEEATGATRRLPTVAEIRARSSDLWLLVDLINEHRRRYRLPAAPMSAKLTAVAALHAKDLAEQRPHDRYGSMHSWSDSDRWTGGGYRAEDKSTWPLMWDKPKEIVAYHGYGFEVCAANVRDVRHALEVWQVSPSHNNVMLNRGIWSDPRWQWQAMGAVFHKGFACAWFGDQRDG